MMDQRLGTLFSFYSTPGPLCDSAWNLSACEYGVRVIYRGLRVYQGLIAFKSVLRANQKGVSQGEDTWMDIQMYRRMDVVPNLRLTIDKNKFVRTKSVSRRLSLCTASEVVTDQRWNGLMYGHTLTVRLTKTKTRLPREIQR